MTKRIISLILLCAVLISCTGCSSTRDLTGSIKANPVAPDADLDSHASDITDFALKLFQNSAHSGENSLVSPVSVLYALAMTANGAEGNTLTQMEEVLGVPVEQLNSYLYTYDSRLSQNDLCSLKLANSIWLRQDSITLSNDYLQTITDYYGAGIYQAPFDNSTAKDINNWVSDNTDGMIENMLEEVPSDVVMYLINALTFDAKWHNTYESWEISNNIFTCEDGTEQTVEFMYSMENQYLESENATGFIKYYEDKEYAFAALLPKEGISINDYLLSLTGENLRSTLTSPQTISVDAAIPKFETEYSTELTKPLIAMGMHDAFDSLTADFSNMGDDSIYISSVLHKTFIAVDEKGTKAGAATVVAAAESGAAFSEDYKTVHLDRPFVYMIIDCDTCLPIFIGTVMSV